MQILVYLIMFAALAGMIWGMIKSKQGMEWGKGLTVGCAVVALGLALPQVLSDGSAKHKKVARKAEEWNLRYNSIAGESVGRYISEKMKSGRIAVVRDASPLADPFVEGLKAGLSNGFELVQDIEPDFATLISRFMQDGMPIDDTMMAGEMYDATMAPMIAGVISAAMMDEILAGVNSDVDVVICLPCLPYDYIDMAFWRNDDHPKLLMIGLNCPFMEVPDLADMISVGRIMALLTNSLDFVYEVGEIPKDVDVAFNNRYVIIDAENIESKREEFMHLFMPLE